ncbi:MAG: polymer-forming cytoskeletal protein [Acidobacteria bacterium]|nr:polymer-forming cytoskeletal protein [Acidobacteriota bacterium]
MPDIVNKRPHLLAPALLACVAVAGGCTPAERPVESAGEAVVVEAEAVVRDQVIAVGRDLELRGEARSDAVVLSGDARVDGVVSGDVIVLDGDVHLGSPARVGGDVFVLGGEVNAESGAAVEGRTVAWPRAPSSLLILAEGPLMGRSPLSPAVAMLNLALLLAWLLVSVVLVWGFDSSLLGTAQSVLERPFRNFFVGLVAVLAVGLTFGLVTAVAPAMIGVPLLVVCAVAAMVCKLWGTVAVFMAVGTRLLPKRGGTAGRAMAAVLVGLLALGLVKMVPWVGGWAWTIVTCIGVGAALDSKLGRRDPWFAGLD